jgi:UDP-2-acetamido-2-deoxy-ribo-hexuluronate aminotransferase
MWDRVLAHKQFIQGPEVFEFEEALAKYLNVKHVITCANGTDALQLVYMALDLDIVHTPAFNYVSSWEAAKLLNIDIHPCDVDYDTFNIDVDTIETPIFKMKRAIVATHLFGQQCNMDAVMLKAQKIGAVVIEDNAQSLGSTCNGKHLTGLVGTTSFFPTKNLACMGDGGAVYTNDDKLAAKIRKIARHGQSEKYHYDCVGINSRLDTIQATVLLENLKTLDGKIAQQVNRAARLAIEHGWPKIENPHTFNNFTIKVKDRSKYQGRVYYPIPLHKTKAYRTNIKLPVSEKLCKEVISITS